jgi:hypothetical protein
MNADLAAITEIESDLKGIEDNAALYQEINFNERTDAIDFIDFHIIDRLGSLPQTTETETLKKRADRLKYQLEKVDAKLFKQLQEDIKAGIHLKSSFTALVNQYLGYDVSKENQPFKPGYDNLDVFADKLLAVGNTPEETLERDTEMVFYQKTPARIVFKMAELAHPQESDVFFDLGSGLGQVAILLNLICGAKTKGVEYEPAYCQYAQSLASSLNLSNVKFVNTDARTADYSTATIFFMYTPFEGSILNDVLELLHQQSLKRTIRIFTYGPCSGLIASYTWLKCINGDGSDLYKLYVFESWVAPITAS